MERTSQARGTKHIYNNCVKISIDYESEPSDCTKRQLEASDFDQLNYDTKTGWDKQDYLKIRRQDNPLSTTAGKGRVSLAPTCKP